MGELGECRCCRKPIPRSQLACPTHWAMLSDELRADIYRTYTMRDMRTYAGHVTRADRVWQELGLWKPPVPMTVRATKQVQALKDLFES